MNPSLSELLQDPETRKIRQARGIGNPPPRTPEAVVADAERVDSMQKWCPSLDPMHPELGVWILNDELEAVVTEWRTERTTR